MSGNKGNIEIKSGLGCVTTILALMPKYSWKEKESKFYELSNYY